MNKSQAIKIFEDEGWTKEDAKRALAAIDFKTNPDELSIRRAMSLFAGSELSQRQRLQAAQKGLVTKKKHELERKEQEYAEKLTYYEKLLKQKIESETEIPLASKNEALEQEYAEKLAHYEKLLKQKIESETEIPDLVSKNETLEAKVKQLMAQNSEITKANERLQKDNKELKNLVDAIRLRLAKDTRKLLQYEDSEIRKALVHLLKWTLG